MSTPTPPAMNRRQQIAQTYQITKRYDRKITLWLLASFLVAGAAGFLLFWLLPPRDGILAWTLAVIGALLFGVLGAMIVFGRRAQKAVYKQLEGQPGAAAAALRMLRKGWKTDTMVGFNKQQDVVHRVVGPAGVVLVGEGNPNRLKPLLATERRKHERVISEAPIHEVSVGDGEGQVPLPKLVRHVQKLGKQVKGPELTDILNRLKALDANRPNVPMPKGPMPTNMKGMRKGMRGR